MTTRSWPPDEHRRRRTQLATRPPHLPVYPVLVCSADLRVYHEFRSRSPRGYRSVQPIRPVVAHPAGRGWPFWLWRPACTRSPGGSTNSDHHRRRSTAPGVIFATPLLCRAAAVASCAHSLDLWASKLSLHADGAETTLTEYVREAEAETCATKFHLSGAQDDPKPTQPAPTPAPCGPARTRLPLHRLSGHTLSTTPTVSERVANPTHRPSPRQVDSGTAHHPLWAGHRCCPAHRGGHRGMGGDLRGRYHRVFHLVGLTQ